MVIFLRSLDCNPDRVQKYCDYLMKENIDYHILCWDRDMKYQMMKNILIFIRMQPMERE